jgi:uncharacterized protein (TIGR02147 family)
MPPLANSAQLTQKEVLRELLEKRLRLGHSLRSLARNAGISPALLSQLQSGKRTLTARTALRLASHLKTDSRERKTLELLAELQAAKGGAGKARLLEEIELLRKGRPAQDLSLEAFKVIADWHHFAILQLLRLDEGEVTPAIAARRLGIDEAVAAEAFTRLEALGQIGRNKCGKYEKLEGDLLVRSEDTNLALRSFHRQTLAKAIDAVERQSPQERYSGSETFAFDPNDLPEVRKVIDDCLDRIVELSRRGKRKTQVYHLATQCFRLTEGRGK